MNKVITFLALALIIIAFRADPPTSAQADQFMWDQLHKGNYDSIPSIISKLHAAYVTEPDNAKTAAHLGFIYLWNFSERFRKTPDSSIVENIYLSNRYFKEALKLNQEDPRIFGFQSAANMCEGAVSRNFPLIIKAYFDGLRSIKKWPQFNKFALSLMESQRDTNSLMYRQAMKYQWELIDDCSCKKLTEDSLMANPDKVLQALISELKNSNDVKIKRVCWNSWIAPHNLEGFFMNFGDMLVKEGSADEARVMYKAAKLSPSYKEWPYKAALEKRLRDMDKNAKEFNQPLQLLERTSDTQLFINSEMSCSGCHQMSKAEFKKYAHHVPANGLF